MLFFISTVKFSALLRRAGLREEHIYKFVMQAIKPAIFLELNSSIYATLFYYYLENDQ